MYTLMNRGDHHEALFTEEARKVRASPLAVPTTCIYSRADGIVAWECCTSVPAPQTENIEVRATHLGYGHEYETLRIIADRLSQPEGAWHPYAGRPDAARRRTRRTRRPLAPTVVGTMSTPTSRTSTGAGRAARRAEQRGPLPLGLASRRDLPHGRDAGDAHARGLPAPPDVPTRRGEDLSPRLLAELRAGPIETPWNLRLQTRMLMRQPVHRWVEDEAFDIDYHVRHSALPSPGGERELGILVSRLHSNALDFRRPPWEMHVIEGLQGGRFAIYAKIHHSLVDGYTGMRILQRGLSPDPGDSDHPFFFGLTKPSRPPRDADPVGDVTSIVRRIANSVRAMPSVARTILDTQLGRGRTSTKAVTSYQAPSSILNQRVGRARRFATQEYDLERLRAVARAQGATLNDVLMAICAGGLRRFLSA